MNSSDNINGFKEAPKKKHSLGALFNNDKFLLFFSLVLSFFIWVFVSANSGESITYTVPDIPVTMDLSEDAINDGLTVVSINGVPVDDYKVSVKVKGNSVTVGSLTASDIQVYGSNLGNIVTSGTYNVSLLARQQGVKTTYDITSLNPSEVTVVVDRNITKEFEIESRITASSPAEYYMGAPTFSSKTVTVTGPEQSVSKVAKAVVVSSVNKELTSTITLEKLNVALLDSNGNEVNDKSLVVEPVTVDATIPVLIKKTVPIILSCKNKPVGLNINNFVTIEPSEIEIAASADVLNTVDSITIGTLDFNELAYNKEYMDFEIVMPEGVRNLNNVEKATVRFNFSSFSTKTLMLSSFQFQNIPEGLVADYSPYSTVMARVIGPKDEVEKLSTLSISAVIDLTDATMGSSDLPLEVNIVGKTSCWIYGTYSVNVTVNSAENVHSSTETDSDGDLAISSE